MIIEDNRTNKLTLDDLCNGDIFEAKFDGEQGIFMKTNETYNSGDFKCVNLYTGEIYEFLRGSKAEKLIAKLVIE